MKLPVPRRSLLYPARVHAMMRRRTVDIISAMPSLTASMKVKKGIKCLGMKMMKHRMTVSKVAVARQSVVSALPKARPMDSPSKKPPDQSINNNEMTIKKRIGKMRSMTCGLYSDLHLLSLYLVGVRISIGILEVPIECLCSSAYFSSAAIRPKS